LSHTRQNIAQFGGGAANVNRRFVVTGLAFS
jgi:hypothetical protein